MGRKNASGRGNVNNKDFLIRCLLMQCSQRRKSLETWKTPTFCGVFFLANFNYKIGGKLRFLTKRCPPVGVSPMSIYTHSVMLLRTDSQPKAPHGAAGHAIESAKTKRGRGKEKKTSRQLTTNVTTIYDILRHSMTISVSLLQWNPLT